MRDIPLEDYEIDPLFYRIGKKFFSEEDLRKIGFEKTATGYYVLLSNRVRGLDLVFEEKGTGFFGVNPDCGRIIFGEKEYPIPSKSRDDELEALYYFQRIENRRRAKENELGLRSGSLIRHNNR